MEVLNGHISSVKFDGGKGWKIVKFKTSEVPGGECTAVGMIPGSVGDSAKLTGDWEDSKYGRQFSLTKNGFAFAENKDKDAIIAYLGRMPGIGPAVASEIFKIFSDDTFNVIKEFPEKLSQVRGITPEKAVEINKQFVAEERQREVIVFLKKFDLTDNKIGKIMSFYGSRVYEVLKFDPYALIEDIDGFGFKTVDAIAMSIGIEKTDTRRVEAVIIWTLQNAEGSGHTHYPEKKLFKEATKEIQLPQKHVEAAMVRLTSNKYLNFASGGRVYFYKTYATEKSVAKHIARLLNE